MGVKSMKEQHPRNRNIWVVTETRFRNLDICSPASNHECLRVYRIVLLRASDDKYRSRSSLVVTGYDFEFNFARKVSMLIKEKFFRTSKICRPASNHERRKVRGILKRGHASLRLVHSRDAEQ